MKILYITTTIDKNDYPSFCQIWFKQPNPSNQNFHHKIISSLAIKNDVEVLSLRPFSKKLCKAKKLDKQTKTSNNIVWNYLTVKGNKFKRIATFSKEYKAFSRSKDLTDYVIISDLINPICIRAATYIAKKANIPLFGVCTDSPSNITGTKKSYTLYLMAKAKKCDGFIALTDELNELFNEDEKPSLIFEGVVEDTSKIKPFKGERDYFFFGGSLLERYGVFNLIKAFKQLNKSDIDLYLAGHSGSISSLKKEIGENQNIKYLGTINVNDVLAYEKGAIANINPRPYSQDLDYFSIPSKTLEYLSSGRPCISVKNTKLQRIFKDEIIWIPSAEKDDITKALKDILDMSEKERKNLGEKALTKVNKCYSLDVIGEKITQFLATF